MTKGSSRRRARAGAAGQIEQADRLLEVGRKEEAIRILRDADRRSPNDAAILGRLGYAFLLQGSARQAIPLLRRSLTLRSEVGEVYYHLGVALQAVGDEASAVVALQDAVRCSPENSEAQGRLADLLMKRGRRSEAAEAYTKASSFEPDTPRARLQKMLALFAADRLLEAEAGLRQLLLVDPENGAAHHLFGLILQTMGKLEEAEAAFECALRCDPNNASAYLGLVSTRKFTDKDRHWIARILGRLEPMEEDTNDVPVRVDPSRMTLHFAVGKVLDDLGEYAEAMNHFHAANRIRQRMLPFNREAMERRLDRLIKRYTPEFFAKHRAMGREDRTPILIVGLPRSGTSLLERILSSHPAVLGRGELDFWNERGPAWAFADPTELAAEADELCEGYLRLLRGDSSNVVRATDKMPFNFYWVGLVHLLFPNAIFVHCRRNPADTLLSIYTTPFMVAWDFANSLGDLASYYHLYSKLMNHWRVVIPPNRLALVNYEDIVARPEETARSMLAFAGLDWDAACLRPESNPQLIATASQWQARQPIYRTSVERWRRYEPWIGELGELVERETAASSEA